MVAALHHYAGDLLCGAAISDQLANYYALSAPTYEQVYARPERQEDLEQLHEKVLEVLREPLVYRDFMLQVPTGPGLGVEIDMDKLHAMQRQ